jgi:hypothetical protein
MESFDQFDLSQALPVSGVAFKWTTADGSSRM